MSHNTLLFLLSLLAVAYAFQPTLEKNLFFLRVNNKLSYQLFQTRTNILAYSIEKVLSGNTSQPYKDVPQYTSINLQSNTTAVILSETMTACGQGPSAFDRLHYHAATSTLVYYCTSNNSLLILNEEDFSVKSVISTGISVSFDEVKLTTDGFSIAVLGMTGFLTAIPAPSQLIKISMQTFEILKHVAFDHGLRSGEAVAGYASDSKGSYVLTNKVTGTTNILTVYLMVLIANNYNLTALGNSTLYAQTTVVSEFFIIGDLFFTNSASELVIINKQGTIVTMTPYLVTKALLSSYNSISRVALASEYGSSDLYTQFTNNSIIKISVSGTSYTSTIIATGSDMQYIVSNRTSNAKLFSLDPLSFNFTITDLVTSQIVYTMPSSYNHFLVTNSTYCIQHQVASGVNISIYDMKTNALIAQLPSSSQYYYDQDQYMYSYLRPTMNQTCELIQIDLVTGELYIPYIFNSTPTATCPLGLVHVKNDGIIVTELVMYNYGANESYSILSPENQLLTYKPPANEYGSTETVVVDYVSMTVYHFVGSQQTNITNVFVYVYEEILQEFTLESSRSYTDLPFGIFYAVPGSVVVFPFEYVPEFGIISVPSLEETKISFTQSWGVLSSFQDVSENIYIVMSDESYFGYNNEPPGIFYSNQVQNLPGTTSYSVSAEASGPCSYSILDGMTTTFGLIRLYSICAEEMINTISA